MSFYCLAGETKKLRYLVLVTMMMNYKMLSSLVSSPSSSFLLSATKLKPQKQHALVHLIERTLITRGQMISSSSNPSNNNNNDTNGDNNRQRKMGYNGNTWKYSSFLVVSSSVGYYYYHNVNYSKRPIIEGTTIPLAYSPQQQQQQQQQRRRKRPPQWGSCIPSLQKQQQSFYSSTTTCKKEESISKKEEDEEDCPLCKKYSQGPCGTIFKKWLSCTDQYKNMTHPTTGEELHLTNCSHIAEKLAHCLEKHVEYYQAIDDKNNQEHIQAWSQFITDFKTDYHPNNNNQTIMIDLSRREKLTKQQALIFHVDIDMQLRLETQTGISVLNEDNDDDSANYHLLCMFVQDENDTILGASSADEIYEHHDTLRFQLHKDTTRHITTVALYEHTKKRNQFLWIQKKQLLPSSQSTKS